MSNENALLDDQYLPGNKEDSEPIISVNKFIILSLCTFGIYEIWWIYKSWRYFKDKEGLDISPVWRAVFTYFFIWQLFDKIKSEAHSIGYTEDYPTNYLTAGFIILNLLARLPQPYFLIYTLSFLCFIQPVKALNYYKQNAAGSNVYVQENFSLKQGILIVLGILFWILVIIGLGAEKQ